MAYGRFKLDRHVLPVTDIGIRSPQKVVWFEIPAQRDFPQDWGPGPKVFMVRGTWFRSEGGLALATEVDALKDRREPLVLQIDENSWKVQCQDFSFHLVRGGGCEFDLELREVAPPETYVFTPQAEVESVGISSTYLTLLKARALAFYFRGLQDRIHEWITEAVVRVNEITGLLEDYVQLAELPWSTLKSVQWAAGIVVDRMDSFIDLINDEFDTMTRRYSEDEESMKQALLYAREVRMRMALLRAACKHAPQREQRYIVQDQDTLATIAAAWNEKHGTDVHWSEIARANEISDPGTLAAGQELVIPA